MSVYCSLMFIRIRLCNLHTILTHSLEAQEMYAHTRSDREKKDGDVGSVYEKVCKDERGP